MKDRASLKAVLLIVGAMLLVLAFSIKRKVAKALIAFGVGLIGASALV